ncbi:MAG: hypothetical protein J6B90_00920 [Lachnospiraceae bacterium]|nr:hypothetical protein [Lachnospiraceae bacterium]
MEFKEFIVKIENSIKEFYGENVKVEVKKITKNNGVILNGVVITKEDENISPTIYLEGFYGDYLKGKAFGRIVQEIIQIYEEHKIKVPINMDFFLDYQAVRGRLFLKVINYEKNEERLVDIPHKRFLDLAVVVYYAYMNDYLGRGSIQVNVSHLDSWGVSQEEVFGEAEKNTREKLGVEILGMKDMLWELMGDRESPEFEQIRENISCMEKEITMHVLTLRGRYYGAASICFPDMLRAFARKCKRNFYILPSSIHELIVIPDTGRENPENLRNMVREVNDDHVDAEEQLSDNIYYFNLESESVILI